MDETPRLLLTLTGNRPGMMFPKRRLGDPAAVPACGSTSPPGWVPAPRVPAERTPRPAPDPPTAPCEQRFCGLLIRLVDGIDRR
jgi:hypothetical protein